jgi:hypothetical protein
LSHGRDEGQLHFQRPKWVVSFHWLSADTRTLASRAGKRTFPMEEMSHRRISWPPSAPAPASRPRPQSSASSASSQFPKIFRNPRAA